MTTWLVRGLRLGLGALFVISGALKLQDPTLFATEIANYRLLYGLAPFLAATLPATEILVGLGVAVFPPAWRRPAVAALLLLLLVFTGAVAQAVLRGIDIDCGCFGGQSGPVTYWTIARNLALLLATALVFVHEQREFVHRASRA